VSGNPYAPPKVVVADSVMDPSPAARPLGVSFAVGLLYLGVALSGLNTIIRFLEFSVGALPITVVALPLVVLCLVAFVTHSISRGQTWARIALLVVVVLGVPVFLLNLRAVLDYTVFTTAVSVFIYVLQIVALYLVFTGVGAQWFRQGKGSSGNKQLELTVTRQRVRAASAAAPLCAHGAHDTSARGRSTAR
jgi:hypothetical protein